MHYLLIFFHGRWRFLCLRLQPSTLGNIKSQYLHYHNLIMVHRRWCFQFLPWVIFLLFIKFIFAHPFPFFPKLLVFLWSLPPSSKPRLCLVPCSGTGFSGIFSGELGAPRLAAPSCLFAAPRCGFLCPGSAGSSFSVCTSVEAEHVLSVCRERVLDKETQSWHVYKCFHSTRTLYSLGVNPILGWNLFSLWNWRLFFRF